MWLKWAGAAAIVAGSVVAGRIIARQFAERPQQLRTLATALQLLETEIAYAATPLPEALQRVAQAIEPPVGALFRTVAATLCQAPGVPLRVAWREAVAAGIRHSALAPEDGRLLVRLGEALGTTDTEGQLKHLRLVQAQLRQAEERSEEERRRNERVWRALGVAVGLMVVIWLY